MLQDLSKKSALSDVINAVAIATKRLNFLPRLVAMGPRVLHPISVYRVTRLIGRSFAQWVIVY
jgi:hypothetical protein